MKLSLIIPAYNASQTLRDVIFKIQNLSLIIEYIHIVDDGSRDNTFEIICELAQDDSRIRAIQHSTNQGYGATLKTAICNETNADILACIHADGQYAPSHLPHLVNIMCERNLDLLQGSRIASKTALSGGMPVYKYIGNRFLTTVENAALGLTMSDYHSGYLLYRRSIFDQINIETLSNSFDFDFELIVAARAKGFAIGESPIQTHYGDEISHLRSIPYGLRCLGILKNYLQKRY